VFGLGFVLSFGYWCTDFLLIQRALAAKNVEAAEQTPIIASVAKLFFPFLVVVPGLAAAALFPASLAQHYDLALPSLMARYYGTGLLGVGVVAMLSSFMSGMAGNITAFNTVWTYDLYQTYLAPRRPDQHYVWVGRLATIVATLLSVATAYIVLRFNSLMDYVQLLFSFFNAPLLATFLLGMFTRWATPAGGLSGLIAGTLAALGHRVLVSLGVLRYGSDMSANFYGAICGFAVCLLITATLSCVTEKKPQEQLKEIVYDRRIFHLRRSHVIAVVVILLACLALNIYFF
jgi:SSS family solute:Na+ symporter